MTKDPSPRARRTEPAAADTLAPADRRVGKTLLTYGLIAVVIGFIMAAILFQTWLLFFIGLIVLVPYAILLMAPVWMARSSRAAEGKSDTAPQGPPGPRAPG